jgi:hypothetical protein
MRFSEETIVGIIIITGVMVLFAGAVALSSWDEQQICVMYQQVYQKSIECRIAYEGRDLRYIDSVCGEVPKWEDYQNK